MNILVLRGQMSDYIYADKAYATHIKESLFAMTDKCKSICGLSNSPIIANGVAVIVLD